MVIKISKSDPAIEAFTDFAEEHRNCQTTETHSITREIEGQTVTFEADHHKADRLRDKILSRGKGYYTTYNIKVDGEMAAGGVAVFDSTLGEPRHAIATFTAAGLASKQPSFLDRLTDAFR